ncbi:hypothetical protein [Kordiimonas laminariae]|uniref:hypothetical protein n=1 Tax=Kordiimonas laminariae TaxID=2917717 RepID=UPI001FF668E3|nr:hypothetical protein [Kordiimonas laminariae]MCK0068628.1 hypothetical protein [Kordiimonas laminariae]
MVPYFKHIPPEEIPSEHPVSLFRAFWESKLASGRLVKWADFSPMSIAEVLPWVLMLEKQPDGRFFYEISGSGCEMLFGVKYEGKFLGDDLPPEATEQRLEEFRIIERGEGPLFSQNTLPIADKQFKEVYRGVFGFQDDDGLLNKIIVVIAPI